MDCKRIEKKEYNINGNTFKIVNTTNLYIDVLWKCDYEEGIPYRIRLRTYNGLFYFNNNEERIYLCDEKEKLILNNNGDPVCSHCKTSVGQDEERPGVVNRKGQAFCNSCYNSIMKIRQKYFVKKD